MESMLTPSRIIPPENAWKNRKLPQFFQNRPPLSSHPTPDSSAQLPFSDTGMGITDEKGCQGFFVIGFFTKAAR
jgi:hypothetical protein